MNHIADNEEYTAGMTSYDHDPYDPFRQTFLCFFFDKRTEFDSGFPFSELCGHMGSKKAPPGAQGEKALFIKTGSGRQPEKAPAEEGRSWGQNSIKKK